MNYIFTTPETPEEWEMYYDIRYRVLRQTWGQEQGSERDETDTTSQNVILHDELGNAIAVGRLHLNSPSQGQIRYMAVDIPYQNSGLGGLMIQELERRAKEQGAKEMILEARQRAIPFYERNGYSVVKMSYLLFGEIQHYTMTKQLD
jgi:N-acetylglutamate synthase-like GNAT family acetyltransferase